MGRAGFKPILSGNQWVYFQEKPTWEKIWKFLEMCVADIYQHEARAYTLDGMCCIIEQFYFVGERDLFFYEPQRALRALRKRKEIEK